MKISKDELARRLLYLPLDISEKVFLWLTYVEIKPVSEITAERRGNLRSLAKKGIKKEPTYNYNSPKSKRIRKWVKDAGMFMVTNGSEWHISKKTSLPKESLETLRKFDYENEVKSGLMFGFPKKSVEAYANNRIAKECEQVPMLLTKNQKFSEPHLEDKYYFPYVLFNLSIADIEGDSLTAKLWAETIRKDVPLLAKWFEKQQKKRNKQS